MTIMQYNMSPETLVKGASKRDTLLTDLIGQKACPELEQAHKLGYAMAANGSMYRKDQRGIFPEMVNLVFNNRVAYKNEMKKSQKQLELVKAEMQKRGIA